MSEIRRNLKLGLVQLRAAGKELENSIELSFLSLRKHLLLRNWVAVAIANVTAWFFEEQYASPSYSTLGIRVIACAIGLVVVIALHYTKAREPGASQRLYLLAFFTLLLPFMFGLIGLLNAIHTEAGESLSVIWIFEYMVALFLFYGLLSKDTHTLGICALAHLLAVVTALLMSGYGLDQILSFSIGMISAQLTMFGFATLTHRRLHFVNQQKIEAAYAIGSKVAHEIRTPLLSIRLITEAAEKRVMAEPVHDQEATSKVALLEQLSNIRKELTFANTTIDMLLVSSSAAPFNYDKHEEIQIADCVSEAITSFPYANTRDREKVMLSESRNFVAVAPYRLILHVLLNLIKNSILSAGAERELLIQICYEIRDGKGELRVRDNGVGIPEGLEERAFENFFSTRATGDGTGLGLAFCKSVMTEIGGDITYSRKNEFTDFVLIFSNIRSL